MKSFILLPVAFSVISPVLSTYTPSHPTKICKDYTIPLTVTSENFIFSVPKFKDNFDVTDFTTDLTSRDAATAFNPWNEHANQPPKKQNQTATYTIAATFCEPSVKTGKNHGKVLLLAHGLNFNRDYWDSKIQPEKYSFVDAAIKRGYSVFFYDRLGVGKSQRVSGYKNQVSIQVALSLKLTALVKAGKYTGSIGKPKKLVLAGHSYGSVISAATVAGEPGIADAVILTGFSYAGNNVNGFVQAAQFKIAATQSPAKWRGLDTGYVTPVNLFSNINIFFKKPDYDVKVAKFSEDNKAPIAISELLTATAADLTPFAYKGAAMVIAGQHDFIFCTSQCDDVIAHPATEIFKNAKAFKAVSYPGSGHGLNFALNAPGAFKIILDFVDKNV